jgi:signal transduction histidine kinase
MPPSLLFVPLQRGLLWRVAFATAAAVAVIALAAGLVGAQLATALAREGLERRASLLAVMTAARLRETPVEQRGILAERTMARVAAVVTVVGPDGFALPNAPPSPLATRDPLLRANHARTLAVWDGKRYFVASEVVVFDGVRHVVLVGVPVQPNPGEIARLLVAVLSVVLALGALGVASAVVVARDIATDVRAITRRARAMASGEAEAIEPLPVRALDEVGALVAAFNRLQRRFADELDAHRAALVRLEDAERRKEVLIATLRHELRTPLNSVIGFAELLLSGVDGDLSEAQREDVEVIARSGRHLLHLVDDVLDLSAIASGRFALEPGPVELMAVVREVSREAMGRARQRNVRLSLDAVPAAIVDGDATSLRRAITNLVQNAVEHAGTEVRLEVQLTGRTVVVSVRDDGPGIRSQDLKRLFKPFERGRSEAPRTGAGLGLAITVALLELHDGSLRVESEVGKGSTFIATLPLRPEALAQAGFA